MDNITTMGERITLALQLKGVKTKDLVDIFGISQQYVSNIKRADKINDTIAQIATHFNINLNWLIMGQGEMFNNPTTNIQKIETVSNEQSKQTFKGINIEILITKLMDFYDIKTITELAQIINTTQPTISGWRSRNAVGALVEKVAEHDNKALEYIFTSQTVQTEYSEATKKEVNSSIIINDILLEKARNEASKFGLDINSYLEHLIIQDLKK